MERRLFVLACFLLIANIHPLQADEKTTQKAIPLENSSTVVPTTTEKPKIKIAENNICKKCKCDTEYHKLDCSNNGLKTLFSNEDWETLQNGDVFFETILFKNNSITDIPIIPAYPVKNLYLGSNKIFNISLGAFQNLDKLTKLDLSHNNLTSKDMKTHMFMGKYATNAYEPLVNMIELDLAYNKLHSLKSDLFIHLPNLESLILCGNPLILIDAVTNMAIASLSNLKTLDLSYTEIGDLPETILHSTSELETLLLSGNLFHTLPTAFKNAKNLKKLVLDENPLGDLVQGDFPDSLTTLTYLSISFLPDIKRIGPYALSPLQNLTTLIAAENSKLASIHRLAFSKNTTNPDLYDYPPLMELYLSNNNLTTFEHNWVARWQGVKTIDLRFNPWACDCTNSWLIHTLMKQINATSAVLTRDVKCATPIAWKNRPLLQMTAQYKELLCENTSHPEKDSLILIGVLVGVLIGIPITLGSVVMYRRGCFGLRNRISPAAPRYNRANFAEDFHI